MTYVLAVDDVEQNLVALQALLASPRITVLCATSGAQALELLLAHDVAVALLDVQMPKMDGFELAELMRGAARTRDVPIIFVTAAGPDPVHRFRGYEAGAVDFLNKPIDPQILRHKVDTFVHLYEQKLRLNEQLDTMTRLLRTNETLTAVLGHDLRNPLDSILGNARLIERASKDEVVRGAAGRISGSVARMARMIDQLLDLARVRSGRLELNAERADLLEIARAAIDEAQAGAPDAAPIVLEHVGDTAGCWDVDRLAQVLSNLLGNALAHGVAGAEIRVSIDGTSARRVRLDVRNQGTIPAELQPSLFEPFKRPARGASPSGGLGLGLHIVQQLVQLHQGAVSVESTRLTGTRVSVELPREARATEAPRVH